MEKAVSLLKKGSQEADSMIFVKFIKTTESWIHLGWKSPVSPPRPAIPSTAPCPQKCIHGAFKPLQGWGIHPCSGQLCQGWTALSMKKYFLIPNINLP